MKAVDIMTAPVIGVRPETTIADAARLIRARQELLAQDGLQIVRELQPHLLLLAGRE